MIRQRWGTFSVKDHCGRYAFLPEIFLYHRLVIPVPTSDDERREWKQRHWDPDLQARKLEALGDLALPTRWGSEYRDHFDKQMARFKSRLDLEDMKREAREALAYQMTRRILAQNEPRPTIRGVSDFLYVSAYQSEADFQADFALARLDLEQ